MKAIILQEAGAVDQLVIQNIAIPVIKTGEVLVQVKAISINPIDIKTRSGKGMYPRIKDQQPVILGWDISGVVSASASDLLKEGDEVFGMVNFPGHGKAYAEYVAAPVEQLALKPVGTTHEQAAAATLAALTAYQALVKAGVRPGCRVLIHAAAGGVGHFAVQIAKYLGAWVAGTSSARNRDFILSLGADEHIDYTTDALEQKARDIDMVLDTIGGDNIDRSLQVMKPGGTIISIPSGLNAEVEAKAAAKGVKGAVFLVTSNGVDMKSIAGLLEQGHIRSVIAQSFPLEEIAVAHTQVETGRTTGKVVVTI